MSEDDTEHDYLLSSQRPQKPSLWRSNCFPCVPKRYIIAVLAFLGFLNVYALRVNLSMAIVVMVNDTNEEGHDKNKEGIIKPHKVHNIL